MRVPPSGILTGYRAIAAWLGPETTVAWLKDQHRRQTPVGACIRKVPGSRFMVADLVELRAVILGKHLTETGQSR